MANPTSVATWSVYSATIDGQNFNADAYDVAIVNQGTSMGSGATAHATALVNTEKILLKDIMEGLANAPYALQVRARIGSFLSGWSVGANFTWNSTLPGAPTGIVINPA